MIVKCVCCQKQLVKAGSWADCVVQWNLSWETTAMRDYLSWQTTHFWQKNLHFNIIEPVLTGHIFVANGVVFQDRFYCSRFACGPDSCSVLFLTTVTGYCYCTAVPYHTISCILEIVSYNNSKIKYWWLSTCDILFCTSVYFLHEMNLWHNTWDSVPVWEPLINW